MRGRKKARTWGAGLKRNETVTDCFSSDARQGGETPGKATKAGPRYGPVLMRYVPAPPFPVPKPTTVVPGGIPGPDNTVPTRIVLEAMAVTVNVLPEMEPFI